MIASARLLTYQGQDAVLVGSQIITERKRLEQTLRDSEERYALAMAGSNEGHWDWYAEAGQFYLSDRAAELLGIEPSERAFATEELERRIHRDDFQTYRDALWNHFRGKDPYYRCEVRFLQPDGQYRWCFIRGLGRRGGERQGHPHERIGRRHHRPQGRRSGSAAQDGPAPGDP